MNTNDFIITVTNNIEGCPIERYLDTICANVVVGTNLFSGTPTLTEEYGFTMLDSELQKKSQFYNEQILEMESPAIFLKE